MIVWLLGLLALLAFVAVFTLVCFLIAILLAYIIVPVWGWAETRGRRG